LRLRAFTRLKKTAFSSNLRETKHNAFNLKFKIFDSQDEICTQSRQDAKFNIIETKTLRLCAFARLKNNYLRQSAKICTISVK
jgi:hypothetical protein